MPRNSAACCGEISASGFITKASPLSANAVKISLIAAKTGAGIVPKIVLPPVSLTKRPLSPTRVARSRRESALLASSRSVSLTCNRVMARSMTGLHPFCSLKCDTGKGFSQGTFGRGQFEAATVAAQSPRPPPATLSSPRPAFPPPMDRTAGWSGCGFTFEPGALSFNPERDIFHFRQPIAGCCLLPGFQHGRKRAGGHAT